MIETKDNQGMEEGMEEMKVDDGWAMEEDGGGWETEEEEEEVG